MQGMTPEFQKRQKPVAALIIAASVAVAGVLIAFFRRK